jgi:outer membrane protein assembly factor BamB
MAVSASLTRTIRTLSLAAAVLIAGTAIASAADWPMLMGPTGDGVSAEKGLLKAFPAAGPKVLWTAKLGAGYGPPAILGGQVFILDRVDGKQDVLRCLDLATGTEKWNYAYDAPGKVDHDGSRSTPAVTDKYVYTISAFGLFHCIDRTTHKPIWSKNLLADYGTKLPQWAVAQSPVLYKGLVLVAPQTGNIGVIAFDQVTGKEVWHSSGLGGMAYASPRVLTLGGVEQIVMVTGNGATGLSTEGKTLWSFAHRCQIAVPGVSVLPGDKLFITGGYNAGSATFQVTNAGGTWSTKELGKSSAGSQCHFGLVVGANVYTLCNTNDKADGLVCFDADCKIVWQTKREPYLDKGGSILTGDGLIYIMDGEKGDLHIVQPTPEGFKSLSKAKLLSASPIWAPLSLSDGKLVIRDQSELKCVDIKAP